MGIRTALLAATVVPGFLLVAHPAMAEPLPSKDVVVAQAQTDQERDRRQQRGGQRSGGRPRRQAKHAKHKALRAGHANISGHPFRRAFQRMHQRPQGLHELERAL